MTTLSADDPVLRMLKYEPSELMQKLPPLPDQLIQRKLPPENGSKEEEKLTEAQKLNMANPLGVIMFGGQPEPVKLPKVEPPVSRDGSMSPPSGTVKGE